MRPRKTKRGFTLLELTIAVTITAITGLSVAAATIALSKAHQDTEDFYQSLQSARSAMVRIQRAINKAELVTACSGTAMILWAEDTNGDGTINADELAILTLDVATGEVRLYRQSFPPGLLQALNLTTPLANLGAVDTVIQTMLTGGHSTATVLATDVAEFYLTCKPDPPMTKLVGIRLKVGVGTQQMALRGAASTRAGKTAQVTMVEGAFTLLSP